MGPATGVRLGVYTPPGLWCQQLEQVGFSVPAPGVGEGLGISHWAGTVGHRACLCPGCQLLGETRVSEVNEDHSISSRSGDSRSQGLCLGASCWEGVECLHFTLTFCACVCVSNLLAKFKLD